MEDKKKSGLETASMVWGIVGIGTSFIPFVDILSIIMAIIAFIFGMISLLKRSGSGKAASGVILATFTVIIALLVLEGVLR